MSDGPQQNPEVEKPSQVSSQAERNWWSGRPNPEIREFLSSHFAQTYHRRFVADQQHGHLAFRLANRDHDAGQSINRVIGIQNKIEGVAEGWGLVHGALKKLGPVGLTVRQKSAEAVMGENLGMLGQEYKIHLQPQPDLIPFAVEQLGQLFDQDPEAVGLMDYFKVSTQPHRTGGTGSPHIVIYPYPGREPARKLLPKVMQHFAQLDHIGTGEIPRYNVKVTELIYFAQSGGDLKSALSQLGLLGKFFDRRINFAFLQGERHHWSNIFPTQIPDCTSWEQLQRMVDTIGYIPTSAGLAYSANEWREKIAKVRMGEASIETITRTDGLRDKVAELLKE